MKFQHHWSGWPGAHCHICGSDSNIENALADPQHSVDCAECPRCSETNCISDDELLTMYRNTIAKGDELLESIVRVAITHRLENLRVRLGD